LSETSAARRGLRYDREVVRLVDCGQWPAARRSLHAYA
jgi:hypothetical protein